ncbi:MAG: diphthamide biosynthesis enzyme Dph2 [Candidatus Bathyarchaeota archaeon]|nr:diphthamide biosynthesis enzyme Dph2 [Candidatus Bathyarchaeota archaeon]
MKQFDLEEERIKQEIIKLGAKRVLIQLPEGLKPEAPYLSKIVEKTGALPIVSADPCYGACDLASADAEALGVDLIIHYGHSKMLKYERVPTIYVEARATLNVEDVVEKALPMLEKWRKIGLTTTVQHVQTLDIVREMLLRAGKIVAIGDAGRLNYAGQVVGCDYSNAKSIAEGVEAFLFIGGGRFHALGVALATSKPTIAADPYEKRVFSVNEEAEKIVKQRWASIQEGERAKSFAVLVGLKPGQRKLEEALMIKEKLEDKGKTTCLLAVKEISPEILMEFPSVDAFVNTACPRVSIDDSSRFKKPLLTINEALVVVGELSWEELCRKGWFEN